MSDDYEVLAGGDADTEKRLGVFPNPSLAECPVVPLGFDGARVIFAMPEGEIRVEAASKISGMLKTDIFCCAAGQAFLTYWRTPEDDKFAAQLAAIWFNRQCRDAGKWDSGRVMRSLGVWPGEAGEVVLHRGGELVIFRPDGTRSTMTISEALRVRRGPLYRLRPPAPQPQEPSSAADGAWLRHQLDLWRFQAFEAEGLTGADVTAGWMMAALLGAVAPFRGHLLLNALPGSGKTTLLTLIHAALSALAGDVINSFSEAGFRADIQGMARPALVDEAEASGGEFGPGPVEQVLNLLRLMATGQGANRRMAEQGGGSMAQTAVGAVLLAAVSPPKLDSALATRVAEVKLLPLDGADLDDEDRAAQVVALSGADRRVIAATAKARELAPAFLARALAGAWRYQADVERMKAALVEVGEDPRTSDLVAMLAAGRRLLMFDEPLTAETAKDEARFWRPLLARRETMEVKSNAGADALAHMMAADGGQFSGDRRLTIGEMIGRWAKGGSADYGEVLKAHGLRLYEGPGKDGRPGPWLIVANHHPGLDRIFGRTSWKDYRRTLEYLDALGPEHATWPTKPQNFGVGVKQRGLAIPLTPWLEGSIRVGVPASVPGSVPRDDVEF